MVPQHQPALVALGMVWRRGCSHEQPGRGGALDALQEPVAVERRVPRAYGQEPALAALGMERDAPLVIGGRPAPVPAAGGGEGGEAAASEAKWEAAVRRRNIEGESAALESRLSCGSRADAAERWLRRLLSAAWLSASLRVQVGVGLAGSGRLLRLAWRPQPSQAERWIRCYLQRGRRWCGG